MTVYYEEILHTNTTDTEETVFEITSSEEEKYKIIEIGVYSETNKGILRWYMERERIGEAPTGYASIQNKIIYDIDTELPVGRTFKITLQNESAGVNASISGYVKYLIA